MSLLLCGVITDIEGPEAFAVYNGKFYLCGNRGALKSFKTFSGSSPCTPLRLDRDKPRYGIDPLPTSL
jgi:hypothetical protein